MNPKMEAAIKRERAADEVMRETADELEKFVGDEEDGDPEDRAEKRDEAQAKFDKAEADLKAARADIATIEHIDAQRSQVPRELPASTTSTASGLNVQVVSEAPTYARGARVSFFKDLVDAGSGHPEALDRLRRNNAEYGVKMQAAGLTQTATAGGEFVPPVWYIDQYAALLRQGRPFVDAVGTAPLPPDTNSINLPKITTGSSVAVQTDTGSVSNTDLVTTSVTAQVQTVAGRTVASYQVVDLGPLTDQVIMQDLTFAYNTALDTAVLTGNVANAKGVLNTTGVNAITYTDASPTGAEFYVPVAQAASKIETGAFVGTDLLCTHPSVWYNILAGLDSQTRPLYLATGQGFNAMGAGDLQAPTPISGNIAGIPLVTDANMPTNLGGGTNESRLVGLNRMGFNIWESGPRFKVADQTSITTLQYQFVAYGYYAVMSRQPKMISIVSGTGLIPVSGF